jgi:3-deoxy-D-manno-octulosonic-acid transferase
MSQILFITFLIIVCLIRVPLSFIVIVLRPLVPFIKKRLNFERKNLIEVSGRSFRRDDLVADFCFEVSSEGELEQVRPLLEAILLEKKRVEILFSSESVEKKCLNLYERYPDTLRLLRLPILSFWPFEFLYFQSIWSWVSAPVIVFCRYDFFPELLLFKLFGKKFALISGAFKKRGFYKIQAFALFDIVVAATDLEKKHFSELLKEKAKLFSCDFRIPRITQRLSGASIVLDSKSPLKEYATYLRGLPASQKIVLGSAWESDLLILKDQDLIEDVKNKKIHLLVVPHKLDKESISRIDEELKKLFGGNNVEVLSASASFKNSPVIILNMSGVLCELYSLFSTSYVGGGYERSIHSVLEPFFSGSSVLCGPKVHRSTEFDLLSEIAPQEIHVLIQAESFYTICKKSFLTKTPDQSIRAHWQKQMEVETGKIIDYLLQRK